MVSTARAQFCHCGAKAARNKDHNCVPIKLFIKITSELASGLPAPGLQSLKESASQ